MKWKQSGVIIDINSETPTGRVPWTEQACLMALAELEEALKVTVRIYKRRRNAGLQPWHKGTVERVCLEEIEGAILSLRESL